MIRPIIIEGASRRRRLDPSKSRPLSLDLVGDENRPVLNWILHALQNIESHEPVYVGGYHIEKVIESFPNLSVRYHHVQDQTGELAALCACNPPDGALLIIRASTVVLGGAVERLIRYPLAKGVYQGDSSVGLFFVDAKRAPEVLAQARALLSTEPLAAIDDLFSRLGIVESVDLGGFAAPIVDQEAVARTIFRGKAQTLDNLAPHVQSASFLPRERISLDEWHSAPDTVLQRISAVFPAQTLVVRSSAGAEDGLHASAAGQYRSVLGVSSADANALRGAIDSVIKSYAINGRVHDSRDEVLVQPQLQDLRASGVCLTRDPRSGAPYFVINEDRTSGRSDVVTAGSEGEIFQQYIAWGGERSEGLAEDTQKVVSLAKELIELSRLDALDIEYAIDRGGHCHILQVRPLPAARRHGGVSDDDVLDLVSGAQGFIAERMRPVAGLVGADTVFGVMPDWNPAEMIGLSPRPLALSLYQMLIGSEAWAEARHIIGYRDVRPEQLIIALGGRPYVDVRASLNSFLPATLDERYAEAWVNSCLVRLRDNPALHDKIEFEIAITCLSPDWKAESRRLAEAGAPVDVFVDHLRSLTESIVNETAAPINLMLSQLDRLSLRRKALCGQRGKGLHSVANEMAHHLQDCRRFGIVPFSILARYAFISMRFLRGFVRNGIVDDALYQEFLRAVPTVARTIAEDIASDLPRGELLARYGHLRPNSYEITSPNYQADPDRFLCAPAQTRHVYSNRSPDEVLGSCADAVRRSLDELGLDISYEQLIRFMVASISGRERAKFEFMKSLNAALECAAELGGFLDLDREKMSFLPIDDLLRLSTDSFAVADSARLRRNVAFNEKRWAATRAIRLPDVIAKAVDVMSFHQELWRANYVTRQCIVARAVWLDDADRPPDLAGAIVVTRAADPGYDWIFAHGIAGLVTEYGGAASHMSIRAAEFGLPAAIGCGAMTIDALRGAKTIELDCASERVRAIA